MEQYDVIVVGGGIIGLCAAFALKEAGVKRLLVIERAWCGQGSTSKATGGIRTQFSSPINVQLSLRGRDYFTRWEEIYGSDPGFHPIGYLFVTADEQRGETLLAQVPQQRALGVEVESLDNRDLHHIVPGMRQEDIRVALLTPRDGVADPGAAVMSVEAACRRQGIKILEHTPVQALVVQGTRITGVRTEAGDIFSSDRVLAATGAWTAPLLSTCGISVPISPHHRQVYRTLPIPDWPTRMPLSVDLDTGLYCHSDGPAVVFGGGDRDATAGYDDTPRPMDVANLIDPLVYRWPRLAAAQIERTWAGLREMTPDDHGIVGRIPQRQGLYVAAGFSGHGFMQAPAVGEIIAALMTGQSSAYDMDALDPARFLGPTKGEAYVF